MTLHVLGFALRLPAPSPHHHSTCPAKHRNSCLRGRWVKPAECFWFTHGRFSFQYFAGSHSGWTQAVVDAPVLRSGLLSLPSWMPGTGVTWAGLQFWLQHPAPYRMKVPNLQAVVCGPSITSDSKVSKNNSWGRGCGIRGVSSWKQSAMLIALEKKVPIHFVLSGSPSFTASGSQRKGSIDICWQLRFCFTLSTNGYVLVADVSTQVWNHKEKAS